MYIQVKILISQQHLVLFLHVRISCKLHMIITIIIREGILRKKNFYAEIQTLNMVTSNGHL